MASSEEIMKQFMKTLGTVPEPIRILGELSPKTLEGYFMTRSSVMEKVVEGGLDLKTKEVIFTLLDTVSGNAPSAKNHARAAIRAGATSRQLLEAHIIAIMVVGISTWEVAGVEALKAAFEEEKSR
jgi:alkylhydroperoxidase/carboxymuconolactone decarboxylase family protein YurZ